MMDIQNNQECFVRLWRQLERTRQHLHGQYRRYCIRNVLKIWHVCHLAAVDDEPQEGWNELPPPSLAPRRHRELIRAVVAVRTGISYYKVNLHELDAAYSIAFPHSTPLNISKKRRQNM